MGAKGGSAPLNKTPPKLPSIPTQTFVTLAAVSRWWLFFLKPTETSEKSRPYWRDDLFFWISTENLVKTRPTQKFWPLQKQILPPLELRSSCGTGMRVKKKCASPTKSLTGRHWINFPVGSLHEKLIILVIEDRAFMNRSTTSEQLKPGQNSAANITNNVTAQS